MPVSTTRSCHRRGWLWSTVANTFTPGGDVLNSAHQTAGDALFALDLPNGSNPSLGAVGSDEGELKIPRRPVVYGALDGRGKKRACFWSVERKRAIQVWLLVWRQIVNSKGLGGPHHGAVAQLHLPPADS
jgi:hypothetical protein